MKQNQEFQIRVYRLYLESGLYFIIIFYLDSRVYPPNFSKKYVNFLISTDTVPPAVVRVNTTCLAIVLSANHFQGRSNLPKSQLII